MSPFAIVFIALSMSADAFAAALGKGCGTRPAAAWRSAALRPDLRLVEAVTLWLAGPLAPPSAPGLTSLPTIGSRLPCWPQSASR